MPNRSMRVGAVVLATSAFIVGVGQTEESKSPIFGGEHDHFHTFNSYSEEKLITYDYSIRIVGRIGYSKNHDSITRLSKGARAEIRVKTLLKRITIIASPGEGETLHLVYRVDGEEREMDDDGWRWLRRIINLEKVRLRQPMEGEEWHQRPRP